MTAPLALPSASFAQLRRLYEDPGAIALDLPAETARRALELARLVLVCEHVGLALSAGRGAAPATWGQAPALPADAFEQVEARVLAGALHLPLRVPLLPSGVGACRTFGVLVAAPAQPAWSSVLPQLSAQLSALLVLDAVGRAGDRDPLTGLRTRAAFERSLLQVAQAGSEGRPAALLMLDVDDLRALNARRSARGGDDFLRSVASVLRGEVRGEGAACRYGGDELALLAFGLDPAAAEALARRVLEAVAAVAAADGLSTSVSIGVACAPAHGRTGEELAFRADQALAAAKQAGKARALLWSEELRGQRRADRLAGILTGDQARDYRNVEALLETVAAVSRLAPLEETLTEVVDRCIEVAGAERGLLLLKDRGGGGEAWQARVARHRGGRPWEGPISFAASLPEQALAEGRAVHRLSRGGSEISTSAQVLGLTAVLCAPLVGEDVPAGAVYVDARAATTRFSPATIAFVAALAGEVATALRNAALYERLLARARRLEADAVGRERELAQVRTLWARERARVPSGGGYEELIGAAPAMAEVFALLRSIESAHVSVLVEGESGTGKELVARAVHARSPRREQPFVTVNCAALAESLFESELFGHVKGSFTGAHTDRAGLIEAAHEGTLFLDEVGELPPNAQAKLLRVLQEGELRRIGDTQQRSVDVRIISATNRDLQAMVGAGEFREDLFYRLAVFRVGLPPLRERPADIPLLIAHLLDDLQARGTSRVQGVSTRARDALVRRRWRGNVRELRNVLERAAALAGEGLIEPDHLEPEREAPAEGVDSSLFELPLQEAKAAFATLYARELVAREGSISAAARQAGSSRQTFYRLLGTKDS